MSEMLQPSELQALFGEEEDYSCSLTDIVHHTEECEQASDCEISVPDPDYEESYAVSYRRKPVFSNKEYYAKLEEIKKAHMRNMAELEKLYLDKLEPEQRERQLMFCCEEKNESEQLELIQVFRKVPAGRLKKSFSHLRSKAQQNSEEHGTFTCTKLNNMVIQARSKPPQRPPHRIRKDSKITIPRPFRMMLREEDRKRRNVKTRSEMELENDRLKKELDELKECGKKFRAKPVPATTHVLLCDIINKQPAKTQHTKPFTFIAREQKKKEKKRADELDIAPKEEQRVFKARPVPKSLYRPSSPRYHMCEVMDPRELQNSLRASGRYPRIPEDTMLGEEDAENQEEQPRVRKVSLCSSSLWKWKNKSILQEIEMERKTRDGDRDWAYIQPLRKTSIGADPQRSCKSDYISV